MVATDGRYHSVGIQFSVPTNKRDDDDLHVVDVTGCHLSCKFLCHRPCSYIDQYRND